MRVHSRLESSKENYETYGLQIFWGDFSHDQDEYLLSSEISRHTTECCELNELEDEKPRQTF